MQKIRTFEVGNTLKLESANKNFSLEKDGNEYVYTLSVGYSTAYGFGEKFNSSNQKGNLVKAAVIEKCFYQGEYTYLSIPFFMSADGFGIYVDTYLEVNFDFRKEGEIKIRFEKGSKGEIADIYFFTGSMKEIMGEFKKLTVSVKVYPKWVLGAWMSSNRWRKQSEIELELKNTIEKEFPHNVLVIEPWSDLTTHYLWGGATTPQKEGGEYAAASEIDYSKSEQWQNPKAMISKLHDSNIKVLLWVVPIYAKGEALESTHNIAQREIDNEFVENNKECVLNKNGSPYQIPHTWCIGSMVPDFTNPHTIKHWFNHFKHLLEIGVDGFKTDGGEFIHDPTVKFFDGTTGREGRSKYCEQYIQSFSEFIGDERVLFSRAGGARVSANTITWAGDQESTWSEFRSILKGGISAGLSGVSNWGFDIGGFSGYLPTKELYLRASQTAALVPIMQWHSDPVKNGRCDFSGSWKNNDRSPWNMAAFHKDEELLTILRNQFNLHYNLIPYQYALMLNANETGVPAMRHLSYEFQQDKNTWNIDDQFMLGDALMVAPVLDDYLNEMNVYFPFGDWFDLFNGKKYAGGKTHGIKLTKENSPVFMRNNCCVPLNLKGGKLCSCVGNDLSGYTELTFLVTGTGSYNFRDDLGNNITVEWTEKDFKVVKNTKNKDCKVLRL